MDPVPGVPGSEAHVLDAVASTADEAILETPPLAPNTLQVIDELPKASLPLLQNTQAQAISKLLEAEAVFSPITTETEMYNEALENEDSNERRMSREDIETMEIMRNEENRKDHITASPTQFNIGDEGQAIVNENGHHNEVAKIEKDSMNTTPSNLSIRSTDPILKQKNTFSSILATDLVEYQWPADDGGDYYMLQEQVSTFLGITSFKRKYPEIERRKLDPQEVKYLMQNMLVNDVQVTLGLTAVRSRDVCDLMIKEYPEKYHEYTQVLDEKQKQSIRNKHMQYSAPSVEKSQMPTYLKKAMKQVSTYNSRLNRQRKEEFAVYYDMQTNVLQHPASKVKKANPDVTKPSLYPCALIPGQFQDYFQKYTASELNYMPLNTVIYGPPQPVPDNPELIETSGSECDTDPGSIDTVSAETRSEKYQLPAAENDTNAAAVPSPAETEGHEETKEEVAAALVNTPSTPDKQAEESENGIRSLDDVKEELEESTVDVDEDADKPICGICLKDETCNKKGEAEDLINCSQCDNHGHPSCLDMSKDLVSVIVTYNWQCLECKTCTYCSKPHHEDKMMFCDRCDRGYHTFCVGLRNLPSGLWMCPTCTRSDPDFAKRGGRRRGSGGTPRKRKVSLEVASQQTETPSKPRRKRRTKKEMEEAREKERLEKEEKLKKKLEKKEEKKKRKRDKKAAEKDLEQAKEVNEGLDESSNYRDEKNADQGAETSIEIISENMQESGSKVMRPPIKNENTTADALHEAKKQNEYEVTSDDVINDRA